MMRLMALVLLIGAVPLAAGELTIGEDSVMAVITHKAGIAKGLAHNHFIFPASYKASLTATPLAAEEGGAEALPPVDLGLEITLQTADLVVDDPEASAHWYPRLEALGLLDEAFADLKDKDRQKIRKAMLGKSQLNEATFKQIEARLLAVEVSPSEVNGIAFAYRLKAAFTIVGKTVETTLAANMSWSEGQLTLEAVGTLKFSDFGISPYSALLGAISNQDNCDIYLSLKAH